MNPITLHYNCNASNILQKWILSELSDINAFWLAQSDLTPDSDLNYLNSVLQKHFNALHGMETIFPHLTSVIDSKILSNCIQLVKDIRIPLVRIQHALYLYASVHKPILLDTWGCNNAYFIRELKERYAAKGIESDLTYNEFAQRIGMYNPKIDESMQGTGYATLKEMIRLQLPCTDYRMNSLHPNLRAQLVANWSNVLGLKL